MNADLLYHRAAIGLFNIIRHRTVGKTKCLREEVLMAFSNLCGYVCWFLRQLFTVIHFPICMTLLLLLNLLPIKSFFSTLDDFPTFLVTSHTYARISLRFLSIIIYHKVLVRDRLHIMLFAVLSMLMVLILLGGDVHQNPGEFSFCHWNLGGLPTNNFLKKTLIEAFLCVNEFDIFIIGESHLTSNTNVNELDIDGYSFKRCDNSNNDARGGIMIYHKTYLPCVFKPNLTKLEETLVLQVKIGTKKVFTCVYRNPSVTNNSKAKIDEFATDLDTTIENIKGKNPYLNFLVGDFNAKNTACWGDISDYPGEKISDIAGVHDLHELINEPTHFYPGKRPSCIDLIFCSQPNFIIESGVLPSLLPQCHHDMIFAKINLNIKH